MLLRDLRIKCHLSVILARTQLAVAVPKNRLIRALVSILWFIYWFIYRLFRRDVAGTPLKEIVDAACEYGACRSAVLSKPVSNDPMVRMEQREQAKVFLKAHRKFIAIVSPNKLYRLDSQRTEEYAHAVVVLGQIGGKIIYHDPDGERGGPCLLMPESDFLDAWEQYYYMAIVVKM
jgi:hypothetical protein